jgi:methionyl-tRNA formyltransferase
VSERTATSTAAERRRLRICFFGTPEFAVPSLRALAQGPHPLVGVVSQPDRPRGRGRRLEPTPVRREAEARGLALLQPERVGDPAALAWLRGLGAELGVVVAFGQFLPRAVRESAALGLINAHASLLPRWRGAAPIAHAILAGDRTTGVTVIQVSREMDAGDYCTMRELEIGAEESAGELAERLAELAAEALLEAVEEIALGRACFLAQDPARVALAPKIGREFGVLDLSRPRDELLRRIRAATPWPGCDLRLERAGHGIRILAAIAAEGAGAEPGRVRVQRGRLLVAAVDGWIEITRLQVPGRRPLGASEFLRGVQLAQDERASAPAQR